MSKKVAVFVANGTEEVEALTVVDVLRRGQLDVDIISTTGTCSVLTSHKVALTADVIAEEADIDAYDAVVIPGGIPGTPNLAANEVVVSTVKKFAKEGKLVAAICAGPSVLGVNGILEGKNAICYPGFEDKLLGANIASTPVVRDGNIITGRGMGVAIEFALEIFSYFTNREAAKELGAKFIYEFE